MKYTKTNRGFALFEFIDCNNVDCSLQKSSVATEDCIWLGCNEPDPRVFVPGEGWKPVIINETLIANNRMHLTRKQVSELLPLLQRFVDTGEIDE